jgi:DEAD/DEAH box helicase domain-containing protein
MSDIQQLIDSIRDNLGPHTITHTETLPAREPTFAEPYPPLSPALAAACQAEGLKQLYTHQVEALQAVRQGRNIVLVTRTSSGKTLAFNLPILEALIENPAHKALYLFPLNALANDQLATLNRLLRHFDPAIRAEAYLGGMSTPQRQAARHSDPHLILTNPEMLHLSLLGHHALWESFWQNLRFVVLDEVHMYRGVFGAHMAALLYRLRRIAAHYGTQLQFIACSATVANPVEHVTSLTGCQPICIDNDGSGQASRTFIFYNPPIINTQQGTRRSYQEDAVQIACACVNRDLQTIVFTRARAAAERMAQMARERFIRAFREDLALKIAAYRAGYLDSERRNIETKLRTGQLSAVFSTNALEAGIDIGSLDIAVLAGLPGSIMSIWQQVGRAGRRDRDAAAVLVASPDPYDQFYINHHQVLFDTPVEQALINAVNPYIWRQHLQCLVQELPGTLADMQALPEPLRELARGLLRTKLIRQKGDRFVAAHSNPHRALNMRSASEETFQLYTESGGKLVGTVSAPQTYWECYPGALYLHAGKTYRVGEWDRTSLSIMLEATNADGYTEAGAVTDVEVEQIEQTHSLAFRGVTIGLGKVSIRVTITDFEEFNLRHQRRRLRELIEPLSFTLDTRAVWLSVPTSLRHELRTLKTDSDVLGSALHSLEHLVRAVIPVRLLCDRNDIDGIAGREHESLGPFALWYDAAPGGIGLADTIFEMLPDLFQAAHQLVIKCPCQSGCPSCDHAGQCSTHNHWLNKQAAQRLLELLQ